MQQICFISLRDESNRINSYEHKYKNNVQLRSYGNRVESSA